MLCNNLSTVADMDTDLSLKEIAALAGVSERVLRNEMDRRVIAPRVRPRAKRRRLGLPSEALLYVMLVRETPVALSQSDRADLYRLITGEGRGAGAWRATTRGFTRDNVTIDAAELRRRTAAKLRVYRRGLSRLSSDPGVLGGEPVFRGTRISVRHVGRLAARVDPAELRADFPGLADDDIEFARLFVQMKPGPGRPRRRLRFRTAAA